MRQLGKLVGVSPASISAVLSNSPFIRVSSETRGRILDAVQSSGYVHRVRVKPQESMFSVAVFSRHAAENPIITSILRGVESGLMPLNGKAFISLTEESHRRVAAGDLSHMQGIDGAIFLSRIDPLCAKALRKRDIPFVVVGSGEWYEEIDMVYVDPLSYARQALAYLRSLGHERIGVSLGSLPHYSYETSLLVYRDYYDRYSPKEKNRCIRTAADDGDILREIEDLVLMKKRPTALVGGIATCEHGVIFAEKLGLRIPADLSILSYDAPGTLAHRPLSYVGIDNSDLGRLGVELLVYRKNQPKAPVRHTIIPARVFEHGSCRKIS